MSCFLFEKFWILDDTMMMPMRLGSQGHGKNGGIFCVSWKRGSHERCWRELRKQLKIQRMAWWPNFYSWHFYKPSQLQKWSCQEWMRWRYHLTTFTLDFCRNLEFVLATKFLADSKLWSLFVCLFDVLPRCLCFQRGKSKQVVPNSCHNSHTYSYQLILAEQVSLERKLFKLRWSIETRLPGFLVSCVRFQHGTRAAVQTEACCEWWPSRTLVFLI